MLMLLAILLALITAIGDGLTTWRFLKLGGREGNPLMRWLERKIGRLPAIVILKAAGLALIWFGFMPFARAYGTAEGYLWTLWLPLIALQAWAIGHNLKFVPELREERRDAVQHP